MIQEDTMNPNFNWAIVAERMQALQVEAETVTRARHAARIRCAAAHARQPRRSRRVLALVPAGSRR
jgi:hypothetical protein